MEAKQSHAVDFYSAFDVYMARVLQMEHIRPQHNHYWHSGICPIVAPTLVSRRCRYWRYGLSSKLASSRGRLQIARQPSFLKGFEHMEITGPEIETVGWMVHIVTAIQQ